MLTEVPDILHSVFHVASKCFTRQKIAEVPWVTELERVLYKQKIRACAKDPSINLFWFCICCQSILPIIKNKKHQQNIGRIYTKEL